LSALTQKFKEVCLTVVPIVIIVLILHFFVTPVDSMELYRFLIGAASIIIGLSVFLLGVDLCITPLGGLFGRTLIKSNKLLFIIAGGLLLGFLISVAEPDLHILAAQAEEVTSGLITRFSLVVVVSSGIAVLLVVGLMRILYGIPLYWVFAGLYLIIGILALLTSYGFLAISFDASGATTGALTVPFILALSFSISTMKKDSKGSEKDSFGLVGIASAGAIIAVMVMGVASGSGELSGQLLEEVVVDTHLMTPFAAALPHIAADSALALSPLFVIFLSFQMFSFRLKKRPFLRILKGFIYSFIGLTLFMLGVNAGFMELGVSLGHAIAAIGSPVLLIFVAFALGTVTILAEPAVHVLTHQIDEVTSGSVRRFFVLIALAVGVGLALVLTAIRIIVPDVELWHILLPGYAVAIALMFFGPKLFVGIAFDSGGVASGPMTATFILAFTQGAASATASADVLIDGFGTIALVALTPLITLQILGIIYRRKTTKGELLK
jgi:hypothetical protein